MAASSNTPLKIEITHRTIIFIVLFAIGLWFVWSIWRIILQLFIAVVLVASFNPLVHRLEHAKIGKFHLNRPAAVTVVYGMVFVVIAGFITIIAQPLVSQTTSLANSLPLLFDRFSGLDLDEAIIEQTIGQLSTLPSDAFRIVSGVFSNLLSVFTTLVMTFYLSLEREKLHKHLAKMFGNTDLEKKVESFINYLEQDLGGWLRAQLVLMFLVGGLTYIGLKILGVPFALPLAIIAGFLELVPNVGPTVAAIPAVIIAFTTVSPLVAVGVIALYAFIQLLENNVIVPQVMSKAVGVNPLVTLVVLLIGFNLGGVMGAIIAVPVVLMSRAIVIHFVDDKWGKQLT